LTDDLSAVEAVRRLREAKKAKSGSGSGLRNSAEIRRRAFLTA